MKFQIVAGLFAVCLAIAPVSLAQRTSVGRDFPIYDNGGKPDLTIDLKRFSNQMEIVDRHFEPSGCAFQEGSIFGTGYRRILRFDTVIINGGDGELVVGSREDPTNPYRDYFYFAECHQHYHIKEFTVYKLLDRSTRAVVKESWKGGFCFEDSFKYSDGKSNGYTCDYQGITSGWGDWYYKQLPGQWIDITGVPEGDYIVRAEINFSANYSFEEGENRYPNFVEVEIHVPDPRNKVDVVE